MITIKWLIKRKNAKTIQDARKKKTELWVKNKRDFDKLTVKQQDTVLDKELI